MHEGAVALLARGLDEDTCCDEQLDSEPDVGAVVADSRIDPERSTPGLATDPILAECVRETMYAADFAAAAAPGQVQVSYPFEFRPGDPDAG